MKKLSLYVFLVLMFCNSAEALPECEGEDDTQWTNCQGTYLKKEIGPGWTRDFTGEFGSVPGKRHGKGSSKVYKDGSFNSTYVGEFKDDKRHGQGTYTWATGMHAGSKYVGEFKNGKREGKATHVFASGNIYVGEFKDGKTHGQGTFTWVTGKSAGAKYVGEFKNGKRDGKGTYTYANGDKYIGEHKNHKFHGEGKMISSDGLTVIEGIFEEDKFIREK